VGGAASALLNAGAVTVPNPAAGLAPRQGGSAFNAV